MGKRVVIVDQYGDEVIELVKKRDESGYYRLPCWGKIVFDRAYDVGDVLRVVELWTEEGER